MKKMSLYVCLLGLLACTKQSKEKSTATVGLSTFQSSNHVHTESIEFYASCPDPATGIDPVVYTGPQDPQTQTIPGFGNHPNDNYDRGWADGYRDALFYQSYIGTDPYMVCHYSIQKGIYDNSVTGNIRWESEGYVLKPGESAAAARIKSEGCSEDYALKKCVLQHASGPRALMLQYQFNNTYPGRTQAQKDYDNGRLAGYRTGINTQPFSF